MIQPLALVLYEKLLPGSQLVNRLQDLSYRVQTINDSAILVECAEEAKPLIVLADLDSSSRNDVLSAITRLRQNSATRHLPVIGCSHESSAELQTAAQAAGVTLFVTDSAVLSYLPQLLDQALQVE
jgi:CheY-like chemotaxis protein